MVSTLDARGLGIMRKPVSGRPSLPPGDAVDSTYPARLSENTLNRLRAKKESTGLPINTQIRQALDLYLSPKEEPEQVAGQMCIPMNPDELAAFEDKAEEFFNIPPDVLLKRLAVTASRKSQAELITFFTGNAIMEEFQRLQKESQQPQKRAKAG